VYDLDPDPGYMIITGFQRTTAEVAAAMNLSPSAASTVVSQADPDAIRERVRREDRRHIWVTAVGDGTTRVDGVLAAEAGIALDNRLTELATGVCRTDPRTIDQRRRPGDQVRRQHHRRRADGAWRR
jgi:hypothetical protein